MRHYYTSFGQNNDHLQTNMEIMSMCTVYLRLGHDTILSVIQTNAETRQSKNFISWNKGNKLCTTSESWSYCNRSTAVKNAKNTLSLWEITANIQNYQHQFPQQLAITAPPTTVSQATASITAPHQ
jgi:hypothetical protein